MYKMKLSIMFSANKDETEVYIYLLVSPNLKSLDFTIKQTILI